MSVRFQASIAIHLKRKSSCFHDVAAVPSSGDCADPSINSSLYQQAFSRSSRLRAVQRNRPPRLRPIHRSLEPSSGPKLFIEAQASINAIVFDWVGQGASIIVGLALTAWAA
jgi:hypothetical protein